MLTFQSPIDIANRGVDHIGSVPIDPRLGFLEKSRPALYMGRLYDKIRRAELQRRTWRFAIKEAVLRAIDPSTMLLAPAVWSGSVTYFFGSIVTDQDGTMWVSRVPNNTNNQPQSSPAYWQLYFGPLTVQPWDTTGGTAYSTGELVYTAPGDGTNRVYVSLVSANSDNPATPTAWSSTVTYFASQIVTKSAIAYMSLIDLNLNQDPAATFVAAWSGATTYAIGARATGSDGYIYVSKQNANTNHNPTLDFTQTWWNPTNTLSPWTTTFVSGSGSLNWRQIGGAEFPFGVTLVRWREIYPLDAGPSNQAHTRNVFRLPAGFLAKAPQDPKMGSLSPLGAPSNDIYDDWLFQDQYLVTYESGPIRFRFVADVVDVASFDAMFCEGLGARLGYETCEPITQSSAKKADCEKAYKHFMDEAKARDAILIGSEEPALDDWLACKM